MLQEAEPPAKLESKDAALLIMLDADGVVDVPEPEEVLELRGFALLGQTKSPIEFIAQLVVEPAAA
jgi:hypothetical protein